MTIASEPNILQIFYLCQNVVKPDNIRLGTKFYQNEYSNQLFI